MDQELIKLLKALQKQLKGTTNLSNQRPLPRAANQPNASAAQQAAQARASARAAAGAQAGMRGAGNAAANLGNALGGLAATAGTASTGIGGAFSRLLGRLTSTGIGLVSINEIMEHVSEAVSKVTSDFFALSRVGLGSTHNLGILYKNALLAGMSLHDYVEVLKTNTELAARSGSLDRFEKLTSMADAQLATMGVFGSEAKAAQAGILNSATLMGIAQSSFKNTLFEQISVFDELRKTVNMTGEEFASLISGLADNEQAQKELVGISGQARIARSKELLQIITTGQRLGMAGDASKKLADALIAQRGETVESRVDSAGRVRQMSGFLGQNDMGERAATIIMKGRKASAKDLEELRKIAGDLDAQGQRAYENGNLGDQHVIESLSAMINQHAFGKLTEANRPVELAAESGKAFNKDFGQHVGAFGQGVGKLLQLVNGFKESVGGAIAGAAIGIAGVMFRGVITRLLLGAGGMAGGGAAATAGATAVANSGTILSRVMTTVGTGLTAVMTPFRAFGGFLTTLVTTFSQIRLVAGTGPAIAGALIDTVMAVGAGIGGVLSTLTAFALKIAPIAGLISAGLELFTGELTAALNPEGGIFNRIGGAVTAFVYAIPSAIISAFEFVFGESNMKWLRRGLDITVSYLNFAFKFAFTKIFGGLASLIKKIPFVGEDSGLVKMLNSMSEGLDESAIANAGATDKLLNDQNATLKSIGAANKEAQKVSDKTTNDTKASTKNAVQALRDFNNVQIGDKLSIPGLINDAKSLIGLPPTSPMITQNPPEVKPPVQEEPKNVEKPQQMKIDNSEVVSSLQSILQVLSQMLTSEQQQASAMQLMADKGRPKFDSSAELITNQMMGISRG